MKAIECQWNGNPGRRRPSSFGACAFGGREAYFLNCKLASRRNPEYETQVEVRVGEGDESYNQQTTTTHTHTLQT